MLSSHPFISRKEPSVPETNPQYSPGLPPSVPTPRTLQTDLSTDDLVQPGLTLTPPIELASSSIESRIGAIYFTMGLF